MSNDSGKFVVGAIIGAAIGAAAGILFAPRTGKETRKIVGEKAKEYAKKGREFVCEEEKAAKNAIKKVAENISK